jgi:glutamate/aspartate transport system substrate-binding protein
MRLKTMFTAIAAIGLFAGTAAAQDGTLKKIKDTGTITIGHRESSIPFSYYDDKQQVVGYAMDLCSKIVDAVKANLKLAKLDVKLQPVTSATRIPLIANGTVDLECGSTTNNLERQKQVSFTITHFVTANRFVSKKAGKVSKLEDLKGKTVVSTSGTTNIKQITELNTQRNLGLTILPAKDHAEAFLMVETGRAAAFVMDDAAFKKVVDDAMTGIYKSGEINKIYDKWFLKPIPPKGVNLNVPMGASFKKVVSKPTDSGDPKDYQ